MKFSVAVFKSKIVNGQFPLVNNLNIICYNHFCFLVFFFYYLAKLSLLRQERTTSQSYHQSFRFNIILTFCFPKVRRANLMKITKMGTRISLWFKKTMDWNMSHEFGWECRHKFKYILWMIVSTYLHLKLFFYTFQNFWVTTF